MTDLVDEVPHSHLDDYGDDLAAYLIHVEEEMIEVCDDDNYVKDLLDEVVRSFGHSAQESAGQKFELAHEETFDDHEEALAPGHGLKSYIHKLFGQFDTNRDDHVSREEIMGFLVAFLESIPHHALNEVRAMFDDKIKRHLEITLHRIQSSDKPISDSNESLNVMVDQAVKAFWEHQLPVFEEVIDAHFENMVNEKQLICDELMEMMDETHDGHVTHADFVRHFANGMLKVIPSAKFGEFVHKVIDTDIHSRSSKAKIAYHMDTQHFKSVGQKLHRYLKQTVQMQVGENPIKGKSWHLLNGNGGLRNFRLHLKKTKESRGRYVADHVRANSVPFHFSCHKIVKELFKAVTDAADKSRGTLTLVYEDVDQEYFKREVGLVRHELVSLVKMYFNRLDLFLFKFLVALVERNCRNEVAHLDPLLARDSVLVFLHYALPLWKRTISKFLWSHTDIEALATQLFVNMDSNNNGYVLKMDFISTFATTFYGCIGSKENQKLLAELLDADFDKAIAVMQSSLSNEFPVPPQNVVTFFQAIEMGDIDTTEKLLSENQDLVRSTCGGKRTSLHVAVAMGWLNLVECLAHQKGVDLNARSARGMTPLHVAVLNNDFDITTYLLSKNVDINASDETGGTPLHYAVQGRRAKIMEILLLRPELNLGVCYEGATPGELAERCGWKDGAKKIRLKEGML